MQVARGVQRSYIYISVSQATGSRGGLLRTGFEYGGDRHEKVKIELQQQIKKHKKELNRKKYI